MGHVDVFQMGMHGAVRQRYVRQRHVRSLDFNQRPCDGAEK